MTRRASAEPLRKITLDVFLSDHEFLKRAHGYGLAQVIRELIRSHVRNIQDGPNVHVTLSGEDTDGY